MLVPVFVVAVVVMTMAGADGQRYTGNRDDLPECRNSPSVRQKEEELRHEMRCPERAVCGDEWRTIRDWYNGTACKERRVVINCQCPGNTQCPVGNPQHVFFANVKHRQYLCEDKCDIGMCSTRFRPSEEMVQNSPEFNLRNYYRINCRCPGHDAPVASRRRSLNRATSYSRLSFNFTNNVVYVQYTCSRRIRMTGYDPCDDNLLV